MNKSWQIPRRTFLKGLGTVMALPVLEAMVPVRVLAAEAAAGGGAFPKRMAFIYIPNGANMADWTPKAAGAEYELPFILEPLKSVRPDFQVISGLAHDKARPNGDGPGDHARASASFLTGCQARKTKGADIKVGVSVDQLAAEKVGRQTRLPSLELSCDKGRLSGDCDSGYSCAYQFNLSWKTESTPMPPEVNPRLIFERLFTGGTAGDLEAGQARRMAYRKSILDFVADDTSSLRSKLGYTDRRKLDEYLTAVRELEVRIEQAEKFAASQPEIAKPTGVPKEYIQHARLMYDLMAIAFQTDTTRVSTFITRHDGDNNPYPTIGVSEGHHDLSHHGNDEEKKVKIAKINRFHVEQFAYFLEKLKSVREGEGTLLDNCMIVYGGAIGDGNRHNHDNLPILLAGRGGGTLTPGRHLKLEKETPMANLYLAMLDRMGVKAERMGDSTGTLDLV
jgi:DNA-binding Lrp family transcriptional regulator